MILVQEKLVSNDVVEQQFLCNLKACKGACCWEGDFGAPLENEELQTLENIYEEIKPFLLEEGKKAIEEQGVFAYYKEDKEYGTPLLKSGACAYLTYDDLGIAKCGIEQAYFAGKTEFRKPISCHLYPIRVTENEQTGFVALNYESWEICSPACDLGTKEKMPLYKFAKDAIIRKFGEEFYEELDGAAQYLKN